MSIVQQRSRTEGTGSNMGDMNMGGGPANHAHVSIFLNVTIEIRRLQREKYETKRFNHM